MPREIRVETEPGQHVIVAPKGNVKIQSARVSSSKDTARIVTAGTYVEPTPPPDPEPDPTPDPSWPPVPANFTTVQAAVNALTASFSVPDGVYRETVTITKPGQEVWFRPGAVLDGGGSLSYALVLNGEGVRIRGELEVRNYNPPLQDGAVRVLKRADVTGIDRRPVLHVHDIKRGAGISSRDHGGSVLEDLWIHHCGQAGYHATNIQDTIWRRWHIHDTNTERVDPGWEAGVGKVSRTRNLVQEDFDVHDVYGHGVWADIDNRGWVVRRARIRNVTHSGIFFEISEGATIEDCVIVNCGHGGSAWAYGAGIQVSSSKDASVRRNIIAWCSRGISVIAQERGGYPVTSPGDYRGIRVEDNVIVDQDGTWMHNWSEDRGPSYDRLFAGSGNGGARNLYWTPVAEPRGDRFQWQGPKDTLAKFEATPAETGGRYMTTAEKDTVLIAAGVPVTP